jgi:tetratricopeptide (TPR) repeat protein
MVKLIKLLLFVICFCFINFTISAQAINCNPNPNGEPWWTGGIDTLADYPDETKGINQLILNNIAESTPLPFMVDNSEKIWFRPIFHQTNGSCAQAAGIAYIFTYEVDRIRNLSASYSQNQYPTHFTYNFLNQGSGSNGSTFLGGIKIIKEFGVPSVKEYGDLINPDAIGLGVDKVWETGYNNYYLALNNKVADSLSYIDVSTPNGLNTLKHWLNDHAQGEESGGLAYFLCKANYNSEIYDILPEDSYDAGKHIVIRWGTNINVAHAMTIVGYNDSIKYDFNGDGVYTNPPDSMSLWEIGAVKVANSWGTSYNDDGFVYMPYRLLTNNVGSIIGHRLQVLNVHDTYLPELLLKLNVYHSGRGALEFSIGYSDNCNDLSPDSTILLYTFDNHGGYLPIHGIDENPIEIGIDLNTFYSQFEVKKLFFDIRESDIHGLYEGTINNLSLVDHRWGEVFELPCNVSGVVIENNSQTQLSIEYDLMQHETPITADVSYNNNKISRFNPIVSDSTTVTFDNNSNLDMYNSNITIESGSCLSLLGYNTITAKKGHNRIIINGDFVIGDSVIFASSQSDTLDIIINTSSNVLFNKTIFNNCNIYANNLQLVSFDSCVFNNCRHVNICCNASVTNTTLNNSYISFNNIPCDNVSNKSVFFVNNKINNVNLDGISVDNYDYYKINNNEISGCRIAVSINDSGNSLTLPAEVSDNIITNCTRGIDLYNSSGVITDNNIYHNVTGVRMLNISNVSVQGSQSPLLSGQQIKDNDSYEIYVSSNAFPATFRYNKIIDEDNDTIPLLYFSQTLSPDSTTIYNVSNNYWGNNFNNQQDIFPYIYFNYLPVWIPENPSKSENIVEGMYYDAINLIKNNDYSSAYEEFKAIIAQYPENSYALSSMKMILFLEELCAGDYSQLREYYLGITDIHLLKLAGILANKCNEFLKRWQDAINWYETILASPSSTEDSIFAVIDLQNLYLRIENGEKTISYTSSMPEYIPSDFEHFIDNRNHLLSLLPFIDKPKGNTLIVDTQATSINVFPNPSNGLTMVDYYISNECNVDIIIYDILGNVVHHYAEGIKDTGNYQIEINDLQKKMYFCILKINGKIEKNKKIIIL